MRVLEASGRTVPDDIALVGFDDTVVAATAEPPLTSVRQPAHLLGSTAASLLLDVIADPEMDTATRADIQQWTGCIAGALTAKPHAWRTERAKRHDQFEPDQAGPGIGGE